MVRPQRRRTAHGRRFVSVLLLALAGTALPPAVAAATIEVLVRERDGRAIEGQRVALQPYGSSDRWFSRRHTLATDATGRLRFEGLEPGTYTFALGPPPDPDLLRPEDNPYAETPVVTLPAADSAAEIALELWRGVPLVINVLSEHTELPRGRIVLTHTETRETVEVPFSRRHGSELHEVRALVEGRWEAAIDAPAGFVVSEILVNGEAIPGGVAGIDSSLDPRTQYLHWRLSAPCEVWGRLLPVGSPEVRGIKVAATLLEPGPWAAAEAERGRVHDRVEPHRWEPNDEFHIRLPEGVWRIAPEGPLLDSSDPPELELRLVPGEVRRQDFAVRMTDDDGARTRLRVEVATPDGDRVPGAFVAVYRGGRAGEEPPRRTGRTGERARFYGRGSVTFTGLGEGTYDVVAGHPEWLDGKQTVEFLPDENEGRQRAIVRLRQGGEARLYAFDHEDRDAVSKVEITAEWVGEMFPSVLEDDALDGARRLRRVRTDATGYATIAGLAAGTYRLEARITGELQMTRYARLRLAGAREVEILELDVHPPRKHEIDVPVYHGASIHGTVICDDDGPVPPMASFVAYAADDTWDGLEPGPVARDGSKPGDTRRRDERRGGRRDGAGREGVAGGSGEGRTPEPLLDVERVPLLGKHLDRFTVGPLEGGAYALAVRPEGYDAWSWVYGTDLRRDAAVLQLPAGEATGVGTVEALCAPAVVIVPRVASGAALPDLRLGTYRVEASRRRDTGEPAPVFPVAEARRGHVLIRGLEEGATELRVELHHPHLIPPRRVHETGTLDLERGVRETEAPRFVDVGGALHVRGEAPAFRLLAGQAVVAVAPAVEGLAAFEGIATGDYGLEPCADVSCTTPAGAGRAERVEPRRTRDVRIGEREGR